MISIILLAVYNGLFISWQQNTNNLADKWSKYWHFLGRVLILSIAFEIIFLHHFYLGFGLIAGILTLFNLSWTIWNLVINITRKLCGADIPLLHIGNGGFNGWLKKRLGVLMVWIIGICFIILNIQAFFEIV